MTEKVLTEKVLNDKNKKSPLKRMGTKHSERGARLPSFTPNFPEARGNVPKKDDFHRVQHLFMKLWVGEFGKKS